MSNSLRTLFFVVALCAAASLCTRKRVLPAAGTAAVAVGVVSVFAAAAAGTDISPSRASSAPADCAVTWTVTNQPVAAVPYAQFYSVAADAPDDAWAVGGPAQLYDTPRHRQAPALTVHWDGSKWRNVPNPLSGALLSGVAADARDDAWAVGQLSGPDGADEPGSGAVAAHWDGVHWKRVSLPPLQKLTAVAATSNRDVWAVGVDRSGGAVVIHWDGTQWQTPSQSTDNEFHVVSALSPSDVWFAGGRPMTSAGGFVEARWDGRGWTTYRQPPPRDGRYGVDPDAELEAMDAVTADDVWAAGNARQAGVPAWPETVLFHWTGGGWHKVTAVRDMWVSALAARVRGDLWLAGIAGDGDAFGGPELWRLARTRWTKAILPVGSEEVTGLTSDQAQGLWAVGATISDFDSSFQYPHRARPLIMRGRCA